MDPEIRRYNSLAEADAADTEYYASLTPQQRLELLFELIEMYRSTHDEDSERLERVYCVDELERC